MLRDQSCLRREHEPWLSSGWDQARRNRETARMKLRDVRHYIKRMRRRVSADELRENGLGSLADALDGLELEANRAIATLQDEAN